jgi:hypothetical protein
MSEPISKTVPPLNSGGKTAAPAHAPVAGGPGVVSAGQPAVATATAAQSPALFGGHRGGGKKRLDGLPAGSPAAIAADKAKDAARKRLDRDKKKTATLPPALSAVVATPANAGAPVAAVASPVPAVAAGVVVPAVAAVPLAHVPWTTRVLEKPAKLLTKILDRARCWSLAKKVRSLKLAPKDEAEILADLRWQEAAANDFSAALADCAQVELNKRRIPGAENSHLINLAMCGGELAMAHFQTLDRLEKMLADKLAAERQLEAERKAAAKIH